MPIGFSYAPGADIPMNGESNGRAPSRLSPQQAVKLISLRVPPALPSNAPVARQLLTSPGGSAAGASGLQSMIQQLMQGYRPAQGLPGAPMQSPLAGPLPSRPGPLPPMQTPTQPAPPNVGGVDFGDYGGFSMDPAEWWTNLLHPDNAASFNPWYGVRPTPAPPAQNTAPPPVKVIVDNPIPGSGGGLA